MPVSVMTKELSCGSIYHIHRNCLSGTLLSSIARTDIFAYLVTSPSALRNAIISRQISVSAAVHK